MSNRRDESWQDRETAVSRKLEPATGKPVRGSARKAVVMARLTTTARLISQLRAQPLRRAATMLPTHHMRSVRVRRLLHMSRLTGAKKRHAPRIAYD
jgi:hypothetical protein